MAAPLTEPRGRRRPVSAGPPLKTSIYRAGGLQEPADSDSMSVPIGCRAGRCACERVPWLRSPQTWGNNGFVILTKPTLAWRLGSCRYCGPAWLGTSAGHRSARKVVSRLQSRRCSEATTADSGVDAYRISPFMPVCVAFEDGAQQPLLVDG